MISPQALAGTTGPAGRLLSLALVFPGCHRRAGVERIVWEASRWFAARGHDVTLYGYASRVEVPDGAPIRIVGIPEPSGPGWIEPLTFGRAAQALLRDDHDLVVSFGVARLRADVLWVNSVHQSWVRAAMRLERDAPLWRHPALRLVSPRHVVMLLVESWYFRQPARLAITVSHQVGNDIGRWYGFPAERLRTVNNGFDPGELRVERRAQERSRERARLGIPDDAVVALMVANELPRKGYGVLLRAVAAACDPRLHVLLAGRIPPDDYRQLTAQLGLQARVHWGGSYSDVAVAHAASDLFVLPTKYEAFCLAVVEAMASGLPPVVSDVPGASDLVRHRENGLVLANPDDWVALSALLIEGLDGASRATWSAAAIETVRGLTWDALFTAAERMMLETT